MKSQIDIPPLSDPHLTVSEAADRLRCSVKTVRRRIYAGHLKSFKMGGQVFILLSELERYMETQIKAAV